MEPSWRPVSTNGSSTIPGFMTTSTCLAGLIISFLSSQPQSVPFFMRGVFSFLTFIMAQTTRMNTTECTRRPVVEGQPVGVAIPGPKTRLTSRNVSGLAITKKVRPEITEMMNFSSCFLPLQPQPQSLKRPMIIFKLDQQKNICSF
jgi:hypothetical protein